MTRFIRRRCGVSSVYGRNCSSLVIVDGNNGVILMYTEIEVECGGKGTETNKACIVGNKEEINYIGGILSICYVC